MSEFGFIRLGDLRIFLILIQKIPKSNESEFRHILLFMNIRTAR